MMKSRSRWRGPSSSFARSRRSDLAISFRASWLWPVGEQIYLVGSRGRDSILNSILNGILNSMLNSIFNSILNSTFPTTSSGNPIQVASPWRRREGALL